MKPSETYYDEKVLDFPPVWPEDHEWINIHDGKNIKESVLEGLIDQHIEESEAIIVVHSDPGVGVRLPKHDIVQFISRHVLKAEIQISNPKFTSFVAILNIGVATGWRTL
jgi:hypothetical protein